MDCIAKLISPHLQRFLVYTCLGMVRTGSVKKKWLAMNCLKVLRCSLKSDDCYGDQQIFPMDRSFGGVYSAVMNPILLDLPMPIFTPHLLLKPRYVGEGITIANAVRESLDNLKPWMPFAQVPPTDEQMEEHCRKSFSEFVARTNITLSIYDREGKTFIGSTGLHRPNWRVPSFHLGYWIHRDFEGKGFITESTNALTRYAFEVLGARRVEIRCDGRNHRSLAVMKKLGFTQEGILRNEDIGVDGSIRDTIITARLDISGLPALQVSWK